MKMLDSDDKDSMTPKEFLLIAAVLIAAFWLLALWVIAAPGSTPTLETYGTRCIIGGTVAAALSWLTSKVDYRRPAEEGGDES